MERLTNKREADAQRKDYENRIKNGYPRNIPEERFLRLAAYEDTKMPPELVEKVAKFAMWVNENGIDRLRHLAEADEVVPATHIQKLGNIVQTIKNGRACRTFSCCGTDCTEMTSWMWPKYCPWCGAKLNGGVCNA
jgi:hypothetical protein